MNTSDNAGRLTQNGSEQRLGRGTRPTGRSSALAMHGGALPIERSCVAKAWNEMHDVLDMGLSMTNNSALRVGGALSADDRPRGSDSHGTTTMSQVGDAASSVRNAMWLLA